MLRKVIIDKKPDGYNITMPLEITGQNIDQQIKLFIEIADYNTMDGYLHTWRFRAYHGREMTIKILRKVIYELDRPSIELNIQRQRMDLKPLFEEVLEKHINKTDQK